MDPQWARNEQDGDTPGLAGSGSSPGTSGILRDGDWDWPRVPGTLSARSSPWHCSATVQEILLEPELVSSGCC